MLHPSLVVLRLILKCSVGSNIRSSVISMLTGRLVTALLNTSVIAGLIAVKSSGAE